MTRGGSRRTLYALIGLGICNHVVLTGTRVTVSLDALSRGASPAIVGVLIALYALLPMLSAVYAGRLSDQVGVRRPMLLGSIGMVLGALLPFALPGLGALFVAASLLGLAFMFFQVATQNATGELGDASERSTNYSLLALGYSVSGFLGPLVAGFTIDRFGFGIAFLLLALFPLAPIALLAGGRLALPGPHLHRDPAIRRGIRALIGHRKLRVVLVLNALFALGWDLHTVFVPIYGARIGLTASQIGLVLSAFAAATFLVRLAMPVIARQLNEHQVMMFALFVAGGVYLLLPFSTGVATLMTLSFTLGLGLGSGQPMVMALLHTHSPPGRMGETAGVRMSLIQSMAVAVPLVFGALGSSLGLLPVFWSVGVCLTTGGFIARRST